MNWANKTQMLLKQYDLNNVDPTMMSKMAWKQIVKERVNTHAFKIKKRL